MQGKSWAAWSLAARAPPGVSDIGLPIERSTADARRRWCHVDGQRVPGSRFDAPAIQAVLTALVALRACCPTGFANRDLRVWR